MSDARAELSEFLRSRRARLHPEDTGLPLFGTRRRVPGLRREELAQLAGVSVDYYVRLEQGRLDNVSESVVDAVARALRLDDTERRHLHNIARPAKLQVRARQRVRPSLQWMLDSMTDAPAYVLGHRTDVIAWNSMACAMLDVDLNALTPEQRNMARLVFLDDTSRNVWSPWEEKALNTVGGLRMHVGLYPDDPKLTELVGELSAASADFRRLWAAQHVWTEPHGTLRLDHPAAGEFTLAFEALSLPGEPEQCLVTYTAEPGSDAAGALRLLASRWKSRILSAANETATATRPAAWTTDAAGAK